MKEQHFKYLKETMDKLMDTLKIKMMNNQKELMNKIETLKRKTGTVTRKEN